MIPNKMTPVSEKLSLDHPHVILYNAVKDPEWLAEQLCKLNKRLNNLELRFMDSGTFRVGSSEPPTS